MNELNNGGNGEKAKGEPPEVCGTCKFWHVIIQNPQNGMAIGVCTNKDCDDEGVQKAPFGFVVVPGAEACGGEGWELRPKKTIIQAPKGIALNGRLAPNKRI